MTVKDLKKAIADLPDHMDVMVEQTNDEGRYGMSERVEVRAVLFQDEEIPSEEWDRVECLVISDDI